MNNIILVKMGNEMAGKFKAVIAVIRYGSTASYSFFCNIVLENQ